MLPGVGTKDDIRAAQDNGGSICRIATHCTEADVSIQHFGLARELGLETVGFLMMSHTSRPEVLAEQARIMADAGCQCVYVVDSAGALILEDVADRVAALVAELGDDAQVGFHGHENLGLGVANTRRWPCAPGAKQIDGSIRRFGAGAGNTPVEAFVGGVRQARHQDRHRLPRDHRRRRGRRRARRWTASACSTGMALIMGYAGRLLELPQARQPAAERYGVSGAEILHRGRPAQADRRPGGPAHRHRSSTSRWRSSANRTRVSRPERDP